ncbi:endonuclease/exonuclease/phosphatase family protein [Streptomyces sp. NBC_00102]|uniref:endonuclease/exonuclease/phosphatase family protein n=1 Tax=Streptomyces sp. NBC_00102 TaxID=2975652 RepID=UPI002253E1C7|nr:endonuclease/exonuclease/phosphatase family protein [Streptomyces sp. NBC_00102]MCX5401797.1 endonuclease/exonuclease/phosphatase family protein [Streptomyces sp. NBC_00102]
MRDGTTLGTEGASDASPDASRRFDGTGAPVTGRGRRRARRGRTWGLSACGLVLAVPAALLLVRLTGRDTGTPLAVPMVLFPHSAVLALLVLGVAIAVRALRSGVVAAVALVLLLAQVWLVAPRFVADAGSGDVPASAARLRVATLNTDEGAVDPRAVVEMVRADRIDVLAVEQTPARGLDALDGAGLGDLLPYHALHPEYDSSIYSRFPLTAADTTDIDTVWPQTTARVAVGGRTVRLAAIHTYYPLGNVGRWTRDMASLAVLARDDGPDTVFLGDFNATLDHAPMRSLLAAGLTDTHAELGRGWAPTWPVGTGIMPPLVQLDHVLHGSGLAGVSVRERTLAGTDHRAVVAELAVLPEKAAVLLTG